MKKTQSIYLIYCMCFVFVYIISAFYDADIALMLMILSTIVSGILLIRLFYKTTTKNTYVPVYNEESNKIVEAYDDYIYSNYINKKICKKYNKKYILLFVITSYILGFMFFVIYFKPLFLLFYIIYILLGFLLGMLYIKGEKEFQLSHKKDDMIHRKKGFKYILYFTIGGLFGLAIISVSFYNVIGLVTEYFTENEIRIMISNIEKKYGDGEKYNYLFHTEKCDIVGKNCQISINGYFDSDIHGLTALYSRDKDGKLYLKTIYDGRSKEEYFEMAKNSYNKKLKLD